MKLTILGAGDAFASHGLRQSGYVIEAEGRTILMEAGPTLLSALKQSGFHPSDLDLVLISHLHGDHFGGLPFLILDYMWESPMKESFTIAGPQGLEERTRTIFKNMFSTAPEDRLAHPLRFRVLEAGAGADFDGVQVATIRTPHTDPDVSLAFRITIGGKTVVFSGDTGWTEEIVPFCAGADLLLCECTYFESVQAETHLNYPLIARQRPRLNVRRMLLTHLGREVLQRRAEVGMEMAFDGMEIEV
jgi:ribonuclease BN (tRNA processing enzyme)